MSSIQQVAPTFSPLSSEAILSQLSPPPLAGAASPKNEHLVHGKGVVLVVGDVDFLSDRNAVEKLDLAVRC